MVVIEYHAEFPEWAVALFLLGWLLLVVALFVGTYLDHRS